MTPSLAAALLAGVGLAMLAVMPIPQQAVSREPVQTVAIEPDRDDAAHVVLRRVRVVLASPFGPEFEMAPASNAAVRRSAVQKLVAEVPDNETLTGAVIPVVRHVPQRAIEKQWSAKGSHAEFVKTERRSRDAAMASGVRPNSPRHVVVSAPSADYATSFDERRM
jgi:hypothetical protein